MLAGFILLFAPQKLTSKFQLAFAHLFRFPLSIGRNISLSARVQQPLRDVVSRREYNKIQNYLANVEQELNQKHLKLKKLSGYDRLYSLEGAKLVMADVSTDAIDALHAELIINRGHIDGLAVGQFVLGDNSIIGTISELSSRTARVKLFTDPTSKIAVKIEKLNIDRIMQGSGNYSAKIPLVSKEHDIKAGDRVYARKEPGLLDAPMIIAKVAKCKQDDENPSVWDITVEPACNIEILNDVAVIIMNPASPNGWMNPQK